MENNVPQLPSESDFGTLDRERYDLSQYWLDPTIEYEEPYFLFEYKGVGFSPLGGIQAVSGQKKNGKTFFLTMLMAIIVNPDAERVRAELPGLAIPARTREYIGEEPTALFIDTEMETLNTAKVFRRVQWLCGLPTQQRNPRLNILALRDVTDNTIRKDMVLQAIAELQPRVVFIDGLRDLLVDINSAEESVPLINELMKMAKRGDCCIWSALHGNPKIKADVEDNKMRGVIGTELGNKVSDTFVIVKKKAPDGVTFKVAQQDARGKDVEDFTFEVTDAAGGLGVPRIIEDYQPVEVVKQQMAKVKFTQDELNYLRQALSTPGVTDSFNKVVSRLAEISGMNMDKALKLFKKAQKDKVVVQEQCGIKKVYTYVSPAYEEPF